jgi:hypothetical protein
MVPSASAAAAEKEMLDGALTTVPLAGVVMLTVGSAFPTETETGELATTPPRESRALAVRE